ncbi:hypothetical protein TA3x_000670 [Tundrisphaera sp. TA3]|uniref:hypothetical protein n=1 Tax=Tundrisphaera sp. TA3 TaxID=3435775 RepID=UPI003EBE4545
MNSVRLYSNGTAVISRDYPFRGEESLRIAIPVRRDDLDDVVSSLAVFGDLAIVGPPTYTPTNAEDTSLEIDPAHALRDLATRMAGASVEVEAGPVYAGRLVGRQPYRRESEHGVVEQYRLVILTAKGIQQVDESSITALRFADPAVQAEVDRSLMARLGRIRPDRSEVAMTFRPHPGATVATVTYATPVAAWKIRYQLRMAAGKAELDGQAVVDNDTDDDWSHALITVITGEPITFSTDLAEIRRPARGRVNVVADRAAGAVIASPDLPPAVGEAWSDDAPAAAACAPMILSKRAPSFGGGTLRDAGRTEKARAKQPAAEARESGDFSIFTSPEPIDVAAGRSAIIPLFRTDAGEARACLLYRERDDPRRPFRAVRFRNPAAYALGRGVCEVFIDGDFRGKSLLESAGPGEEILLVHARENGVRVFREDHDHETRRMAIRISDGMVVSEKLHRRRTSYRIGSTLPEALPLEVEHPRDSADSRLRVDIPGGDGHEESDIPGGVRIRTLLAAGGSIAIQVVEESVDRREYRLEESWSWLSASLISWDGPAGPDPALQECMDAQRRVDDLEAEIKELEQKAKVLADEQARLIKLIPNGHAEQANAWRTDLAEAEAELRQARRSALPKLRARLKEARSELQEAFARLQFVREEPAQADGPA